MKEIFGILTPLNSLYSFYLTMNFVCVRED